MGIATQVFGKTHEGREVLLYTISNNKGMSARITNYGCIIVSLMVPDKNNRVKDITLGYDKLEDYITANPFFGAVVGRHANRIENAAFILNDKEYKLAKNNGNNHIHGGIKGFDKVLWDSAVITGTGGKSLEFTYTSVDGEENYPGNLSVKVNYTLTDNNELRIDYYAVSDKDTVVNLTNHSYFNLAGHDGGNISGHQLRINGDCFTEINDECLPTGKIIDVKGTPMDFTKIAPVSKGINSDYEQIQYGKGYDHNWVLNTKGNLGIAAVELHEPESGRRMEVYTTKPGIQFYSGNFLNIPYAGKGGTRYQKRSGLCLETQYFPNALKHTHFPSPILKAGDKYEYTTIYKFLNS